jgi:hypothetical protein
LNGVQQPLHILPGVRGGSGEKGVEREVEEVEV